MSHSPFLWCSSACYESNDGLSFWVILGEPFASLFFIFTSDFSNHYDTFSFGVFHESGENINEVGSIERIATNANDSGLAQSLLGWLVDSLVGQGAWPGHNTNLSGFVNVAGHDSDFAFIGLNDSRAVGANHSAHWLRTEGVLHFDHVVLGNSIRDGHNQFDFSFDCFHNCICCCGGRNVDNWGVAACCLFCLSAIFEHWKA